ncbi:regulator [Streptomyces ambofaciens]|uniref:Regulator n=2 Tax=Streptomyces ambofaciens TaxID=1889 RepID=A0ABN4P5Y9_STRAM|nr:ATP-binding protein [Streptomyces ambofaciens]ANB06627.1 regulator [Streptomyces ambofaciens]
MGSAVNRAARAWKLPFSAEAEEVAGLRRILRLRLELWDVQELSDAAELCVSELVANVIKHVGPGTPTTLAVSTNGTRLRIEVHDPSTRALPVLTDVSAEAEEGRGMALIEAITDRWGVDLSADRKSTWCELRTNPTAVDGNAPPSRHVRAADVLGLYASTAVPLRSVGSSRLQATVAEETAIDVIADLLHWLHAHGRDPDHVLDRAQAHFEAEAAAR